MNFKKDLRKLSVAAMAVALAGCEGAQEAKSDSKSVTASGAGITVPTDIPAHCVPIVQDDPGDDPTPVLFRGKGKAGGGKKPKKPGPGGTTGGTTTVGQVGLGAPALQPGVGPDTADACGQASANLPGIPSGPVTRECFFNGADPTVQATVERVLESVDDKDLVHVRLTFNPNFVDNTYGTTSIGWGGSKNGTHTYKDLVGSDHAELLFTNKQDAVALHLKLDYISVDASKPSGYGTLGVLGGEGKVLVGNPSYVREVATSLDRNLNGCGYGSYTTNSPATDAAYTPNASTPNWDYRVVYEMWIAAEAFGSSGFGGVNIEYVHASPSKIGSNTLIVDPGPCPPDVPPPSDPPGDHGDGDAGVGEPPPSDPPGDHGDAGVEPPPACPPGYEPGDPGVPTDPPAPPKVDGGTPVLF